MSDSRKFIPQKVRPQTANKNTLVRQKSGTVKPGLNKTLPRKSKNLKVKRLRRTNN